jgi:hypothetical protein
MGKQSWFRMETAPFGEENVEEHFGWPASQAPGIRTPCWPLGTEDSGASRLAQRGPGEALEASSLFPRQGAAGG